jgi:hypothetical protein
MAEPEIQERIDILRRICDRARVIAVSRKDSLYVDIFQHLLNEIALISKCDEKIKCSICGTTENVRWMGGHQPYLCNSKNCIPF